jgi:DNA-binding winged helix-turn-helix (wHTH) protein
MDWIKTEQCGCVVGLRGFGKSIFLHFLFREDVRRYYLEKDDANFVFIFIDLLNLVEYTEWVTYELILSRLVDQLRCLGTDAADIEPIALLHHEVARSPNLLIAQRAIEQCITILCRQPERRVILFFDEFDTIFRTFNPSLFRCLRALRDAYHGQLSYIVAATNELASLRDNLVEVDHFYRLVSCNICMLRALDPADAREMIGHLTAQHSMKLSEADTLRLIELSGGHGGLLRTLLSLLWGEDYKSELAKPELIINDEPVLQHECCKIWSSLSKDEQESLCSLIHKEAISVQATRHLVYRGLLKKTDVPVIFSPLFAAFVQTQVPFSTKATYISRSSHIVQLDGQRIETLTELEFEILSYLYEQRKRVCTKDDLVASVYRQRYADMQGGVTNNSLQALISRLRKKIEPDHTRPCYVLTVRGEGYKFVGSGL